MLKRRKGQSILEYVIVLIAIVACIAWAATQFIASQTEDEDKQKGVGKLLQQTGEAMKNATKEIANITNTSGGG